MSIEHIEFKISEPYNVGEDKYIHTNLTALYQKIISLENYLIKNKNKKSKLLSNFYLV